MAMIELQRFPGTPKERYRVPNGTLFYTWLKENDGSLHRDLLIVRNGVTLSDDDDLDFELTERDVIQLFDQPKGVISDILSPIFKVVGAVFSFLAPKPAIANTEQQSYRADEHRARLQGEAGYLRPGALVP